jgi:hypothetical protein
MQKNVQRGTWQRKLDRSKKKIFLYVPERKKVKKGKKKVIKKMKSSTLPEI